MTNEANVWNPNEVDGTGKNVIINGNFDIWQRGVSFTSGYTADRWKLGKVGSTAVHTQEAFTLGQIDVPNNPKYYSRTVVTSIVGVGNHANFGQKIEGVETFAGKTVTLSFYAKTIGADKNIAVTLIQNFGTGGAPSAEVNGIGTTKLLITSEWVKYSVTTLIPSVSGKTLGTDLNDTLVSLFWFDAGSNFDLRTDTLGQQNGTFDIAQVQLEEGSITTDFERQHLSTILAECQRYFNKSYSINVDPGTVTIGGAKYNRYSAAVSNLALGVEFPVTMRAAPIITSYSLNGTSGKVSNTTNGFSHVADLTLSGVQALSDKGFGGIALPAPITAGNITGMQYTADAEL